MGDVLKLFALQNATGYADYGTTIDILLDHISDEVALLKDMSLGKGIAGIGWGVEMIAQHRLMAIDTNEVLEEFDDQIYRYVFSGRTADLSLKKGLLGDFLYFLARKHAIGNLHHYKAIVNEECFSFIIDEIARQLNGADGLLQQTKQTDTELLSIAHGLYFFADFYEERVNQETAEKILYAVVDFTDRFLAKPASADGKGLHTLLSLCYYIAGVKHKHEYWKKRAKSFLEQLPVPSQHPNAPIERLNALLYHNYIDKRLKCSIASNPADLASVGNALMLQLAMGKEPLAKLYECFMLIGI